MKMPVVKEHAVPISEDLILASVQKALLGILTPTVVLTLTNVLVGRVERIRFVIMYLEASHVPVKMVSKGILPSRAQVS